MSIVCESDCGWLIDHTLHSIESYKATAKQAEITISDRPSMTIKAAEQNKDAISLTVKPDLFKIYHPFMTELQFEKFKMEKNSEPSLTKKKRRKRKLPLNDGEKDLQEFHNEIKYLVKTALGQLVSIATKVGYFKPLSPNQRQSNNEVARAIAKTLDSVPDEVETVLSKGDAIVAERLVTNIGDTAVRTGLPGLRGLYLIPAHSSFVMSEFSNLQPLLSTGNKFDVIVMDPPWSNKSVKRKRTYDSMWEVDLEKLQMDELTREGTIVLVWVTNKQKLLRYVKEVLFPLWNVQQVAQWLWLKVTVDGTPIYDIDSPHKKPYEIILIGKCIRPELSTEDYTATTPNCNENNENCFETKKSCFEEATVDHTSIPDGKVIVSIPCSIHSSKPPLTELLKTFTKPKAECLELFARNLLPGWTSWGNEVLKHQHISCYEETSTTGKD